MLKWRRSPYAGHTFWMSIKKECFQDFGSEISWKTIIYEIGEEIGRQKQHYIYIHRVWRCGTEEAYIFTGELLIMMNLGVCYQRINTHLTGIFSWFSINSIDNAIVSDYWNSSNRISYNHINKHIVSILTSHTKNIMTSFNDA
jgi:hypothetical protein